MSVGKTVFVLTPQVLVSSLTSPLQRKTGTSKIRVWKLLRLDSLRENSVFRVFILKNRKAN